VTVPRGGEHSLYLGPGRLNGAAKYAGGGDPSLSQRSRGHEVTAQCITYALDPLGSGAVKFPTSDEMGEEVINIGEGVVYTSNLCGVQPFERLLSSEEA
jgi:hypothetical protein